MKKCICLSALLVTFAQASSASGVPMSFRYGGTAAKGLDAAAVTETKTSPEAVRRTREWRSPDGRLVLRVAETDYRDFPVTEYAPTLAAAGDEPTQLVEDFRSLAYASSATNALVRALHGTVCTERDFEAVHMRLGAGGGATNAWAMVATEGRSSAQWMPWWGVDFPDGSGLEVGLGWSGAWRADFTCGARGFAMAAGMVRTRLRLLPGETLRQPSLLVFRRDKGTSPREMQTLVHRFMVRHKSPRDAQGRLIAPILPITAGGGNKTPEMMHKVIRWKQEQQMPFDCFWVDAGWNGPAHMPDLLSNCGNMWWKFVGDWRFNPTVHPDGNLAKVADAAHAAGMRMLLWVEPERCVSEPPPPLFKEHRAWLLPKDDKDIRNPRNLNVNLGDPEARAWMIETVSTLVRDSHLDVYRQDFNLNTLPLWQANDAPDRQGVTEAKYVDGLYRFWDELRVRFPHLMIENCASGGRRLDFEAVSRAHSYCRTDYAIWHRGPSQVTDVQNILLNTLAYVPFQGSETTPALFFDDYGFFSSVAAGSVFTPSDWNGGIVKNAFTSEQNAWFRKVFRAADRMRTFFTGDYYPLVDVEPPPRRANAWDGWSKPTILPDEERWMAYQMHRADLDAGYALAFRRLDTPSHVFAATLSGIDPRATYEVETYDGATSRMSGAELARFRVVLARPRDFRLVFYRRVTDAQAPARLETFRPGAVKVGGEIGRRLEATVDKMLRHTDVEQTFARHFRERKAAPEILWGFAGYGMFLDALVKAAAHGIGGEATVAAKTRLLADVAGMVTTNNLFTMYLGKAGFWDAHEGAYLIQALARDHRWFGSAQSLATARRVADGLIARKAPPTLGSETAYLLLYEETRDERYLAWLEGDAAISADIDAYDRTIHVNGVQHVYTWLARALAQLQYADLKGCGEAERAALGAAATEAFRRCRTPYMSVTGSVTGTPRWGELWDATQAGLGKWGETCASAYLMRLAAKAMERDASAYYGDLFERVLYNAFFSAQSADGLKYRYWTPFNEQPTWFDRDTYCCPNNYKREVFEVPDAVFFKTPDGLAVNLYSDATLKGEGFSATMATAYPDEGHVRLAVTMPRGKRRLYLRIPAWCHGARASVAGGAQRTATAGWLRLEHDFAHATEVTLDLPMAPRLVRGVRAQEGRVALMRGPCVYALGDAAGRFGQGCDHWDLKPDAPFVFDATNHTLAVTLKNRNQKRDERRVPLVRYCHESRVRTYFEPTSPCAPVDDELSHRP